MTSSKKILNMCPRCKKQGLTPVAISIDPLIHVMHCKVCNFRKQIKR